MTGLWNNACLWIPIITWFIVQSYKVVSDLIIHKKLNIKRMWGSGGMPSSHSALVVSLATIVGIREGFDTASFAICIIFASVVMYDAAGVRRAAGKQARVLNQIIEEQDKVKIQEKLIELLGHTPLEVYVGAIIGILSTIIFERLW